MRRATLKPARSLLKFSPYVCAQCRFITRWRMFEEGDVVLLKELSSNPKLKLLRKPLKPGRIIETHKGAVKHEDIIGANLNSIVKTNRGSRYTVHDPTLAEYVTLTPRLVAPIYPEDANVIVNLLDLHPTAPTFSEDGTPVEFEDPEIEIFECGTGHGALTLHLARAIHAANTCVPPSKEETQESNNDGDAAPSEELTSPLQECRAEREAGARAQVVQRRAVIHTMDKSRRNSKHAQTIINGFKNGIYAPSIAFHIGTPKDFFRVRANSDKPFLTHAILDMPAAHDEMATVAHHMHLGGKLLLFAPSITQILDAQRAIKTENIPLYLDRVIELGGGMSGGREWSVRVVRSRASIREDAAAAAAAAASPSEVDLESGESEVEVEPEAETHNVPTDSEKKEPKWLVSCRPKVGKFTQGGGFVALWTRVEHREKMGDADTGFSRGLRDNAASA